MASGPHPKTIKQVVDYLATLGLTVYGPTIDEDGTEYESLMDYTFDDIIIRRKTFNGYVKKDIHN